MVVKKYLNIMHIGIIFIMLTILMIPWYQLGIEFPTIIADGKIIIDTKYIVVGFLFIILVLLKFLESKLETKYKDPTLLTILKKASDRILIHGFLIILAYNGFISVIIPVTLIIKETLMETMRKISADNGKMLEKSFFGLLEKVCLNLGILFLLFYNLPFELWNIFFSDALIMVGTVLSVLNGCLYYFKAKNLLLNDKVSE